MEKLRVGIKPTNFSLGLTVWLTLSLRKDRKQTEKKTASALCLLKAWIFDWIAQTLDKAT